MPLMTPHRVMVRHQTSDGRDAYGNETFSWVEAQADVYLSAEEARADAETNIGEHRWRLIAPASLRLERGDRIEWGGRAFTVTAAPFAPLDPVTGAPTHIEAAIEEAS
ncbi:hypothetical protein [Streptomonospora salina]|uniref:Head-tail adaptor n=1 Tax=Streptomonospora salina TaxID=104205 RepID=A0A841EHB2_9ACTN|nr:hypothetical protein [Streptomonospora salina]MBB6000218.1 head-tail adaptor [Streptomonospora salina]